MRRLYLSLNQGTTVVRNEFGRDTRDELTRRAGIMRSRIPEAAERFTSEPIDLAATGTLARDCEAGHALGTMYHLHDLPFSQVLIYDLQGLVRLYLKLTARGGLEASEGHERAAEEAGLNTITEQRRYTFHRRIERDSTAGREAKKVHGYVCQACGFDFEAVYGPIGRGFIEAHHLTPKSELPEDTPVEQNPKTDFAVLCANCHRMIHKMPDVRNIRVLQDAGNIGELMLVHARLRKS
jgi:5-methylcytosine-specific restriction protein A